MYTLTTSEALLLVRKNLDEQDINDSVIVGDSDSEELESLLLKTLPEAVNAVHAAAPANILEGVICSQYTTIKSLDLVLTLKPNVSDFLRLVSFKVKDSGIVVTDPVLESSPAGRLQANKYLCGTWERPVLVQEQDTVSAPEFRYYSLKSMPTGATKGTAYTIPSNSVSTIVDHFTYIPRYKYDSDRSGYSISTNLKQNIIDQLTGMVLVIYNNEKAQFFLSRASAGLA